MLQNPSCGDKEGGTVEDWLEMVMMAPLDEHRRFLRNLHERRHEIQDFMMIRNKEVDLERRQMAGTKFNRKANVNRDINGSNGGNGGNFRNGPSKGSDGGIAEDDNKGDGFGKSRATTQDDGTRPPSSNSTSRTSSAITVISPETFSSVTPPPPPKSISTRHQSIPSTLLPYESVPTVPTLAASLSYVTPTSPLITLAIPSITPTPQAYPTLESIELLSPWSQTASSSPGRKGLEPGDPGFVPYTSGSSYDYQPTVVMSLPSSSTVGIVATGAGDNEGATQTSDTPVRQGKSHNNLSKAAGQTLIALGVIGALVLLGFIVYLVVHFLKVDVGGYVRRRLNRDERTGSSGSIRAWKLSSWRPSFGHWSRSEVSPSYNEAYAPEKDHSASQRKLKSNSIIIPTTVTTPLVSNPAPFGASSPVEYDPSGGLSFFVTNPDRATMTSNEGGLVRTVSNASNNATYFGTYDPNVPLSQQNRNEVRQQSVAYGPTSRLSELSSLSSGFGDAKIDVPESGPTNVMNANADDTPRGRKSSYFHSGLFGRFSGVTTNHGPNGARDTMYTTTSEDTAPRFRSITSWVNHQTSRVEGQNESENTLVEPVAKRKPPVTAAFQLAQARASMRHSRQHSEDYAFRAHPGQEVRIGRGSRVASSILDGNFGGIEGPRVGRS